MAIVGNMQAHRIGRAGSFFYSALWCAGGVMGCLPTLTYGGPKASAASMYQGGLQSLDYFKGQEDWTETSKYPSTRHRFMKKSSKA